MTTASRLADQPARTHPCIRCGAPIPLEDAICERCNPLGLPQPASSQAHGTVFLAIGIAVVGLAVLGKLTLTGIGPFVGSVVAAVPDPPGISVTIQVRNTGTQAGSATCHIIDASARIGPDAATIETGRIEPGTVVTVAKRIAEYGTELRPLDVDCRAP